MHLMILICEHSREQSCGCEACSKTSKVYGFGFFGPVEKHDRELPETV